ncbi:hypothetical protein NQ317_009474 [Molorchus minor]|uniref:Uncharacterized protein n=1 Tax=Molorchus minor TaxID=1323400 RepID=A0ABQ9J7I6_9CUCU|nr:hypothetical protein NQ317_009474 [Molorchus minor]
MVTGLLTGHCHLSRHLQLIGIAEDPECRWCLEDEETSSHVLTEYPAIARTIERHFGSSALNPEIVKTETQGKFDTLQWRTIHLGGLYHLEEEIIMSTTVPNFVGDIQQFYFNNIPYIELARALSTEQSISGFPTIKVAAKFVKHATDNLHRPVTFRSKHTFIGLPMLRAYSSIHIDFMFRTREADGLIMFNGGKKEDFVAVELVDGHINYAVNVGDGTVILRDTVKTNLNDNRWHTVGIRRPSVRQHTLMVDDDIVIATNFGTGNLELDGILYLGGVYKDLYAQLPQDDVKSRYGFEVAWLGQTAKCSHNVCANAGICVQQWNSYTCDCDMTSFTGPTCSDESVSYEFGPNRGIITYTFPEDNRPEMQEDAIAIGFITSKSDAVLLRIVSGTSNDYIEMYIVEGNVFAVYNLGTGDHPIGDISVKVNDNTYHVVRFHRHGYNSTLQVDDYNVQYSHPPEEVVGQFILHTPMSQSPRLELCLIFLCGCVNCCTKCCNKDQDPNQIPEARSEKEEIWLQQDECPAHNERLVMDYLAQTFPEELLSTGGLIPCPPRSPDLTPCDFSTNIDMKEPQSWANCDFIMNILGSITPEVLSNVRKAFYDRLGYCETLEGGHQLQVFNSQSQIQIGGKWSKKGRIERPFSGIISGVVVNGLRIQDLAAEKDIHASIRGDVQLISGIFDRHDHLQKMQQTTASEFPGVQDDLVFSGAGSGCNGDDEDECPPLPENGSGDDDLITPVYVPPTRPPLTPKPPKKNNSLEEKLCDDEDCTVGSGSGEITEEQTTPKTTGDQKVKIY